MEHAQASVFPDDIAEYFRWLIRSRRIDLCEYNVLTDTWIELDSGTVEEWTVIKVLNQLHYHPHELVMQQGPRACLSGDLVPFYARWVNRLERRGISVARIENLDPYFFAIATIAPPLKN